MNEPILPDFGSSIVTVVLTSCYTKIKAGGYVSALASQYMFAAMRAPCTLLSFLFVFALPGCTPPAPRPNQTQGATSPSGKYVLRLPIELQATDPQYKGTHVWKVTISDTTGKVLYKDDESRMVGNLNVYWGWDKQDRVWVYNSDDGRIWRWELADDGWKKLESQKSDGIPDFVLPDYAKKN